MPERRIPACPGIDTRLILATALVPAPWKNGGGVTRQISSWPDEASFDSFIWRVSVAEVRQPGPFSTFDNIDRTIVLTEGTDMTLINTLTGERNLLGRWQPFRFAGEAPVKADLSNGPTSDFNLMVRRGYGQGQVDVRNAAERLTLHPGSTILHCAQGSFHVSIVAPNQPMHVLGAGDTLQLRLSAPEPLTVDIAPAQPESALIDARITIRKQEPRT